jgi:hypothetical protein
MKKTALLLSALVLLGAHSGRAVAASGAPGDAASTPAELVRAYDALADTILAVKKTESNMVRSILATTYGHAEAAFRMAKGKLNAGQDARKEIERLADLVAQIGNEGDAHVAGIRKRLVEGGHHHNAVGEQQGLYDPGFVIVTRKAKKMFLDAAGNIARLAAPSDVTKLEAEWKSVVDQYRTLQKGA